MELQNAEAAYVSDWNYAWRMSFEFYVQINKTTLKDMNK